MGSHRLAHIAWHMTLASFLCVSERLLKRALRDRDALHADIEPAAIHHREHAGKPLVLLADKKARRAAMIAIDHRAGGRGMDAELMLQRDAMDIVARPNRAIGIDEKFRHEEERDAARSLRRIGQAREHEMNDVSLMSCSP